MLPARNASHSDADGSTRSVLTMPIDNSKPKKVMTLCILRKRDDLLMGLKKLRLGRGFYNGFGGKLEPDETLEECIVREVKEESGLDLLLFDKIGVIFFVFDYKIIKLWTIKSQKFDKFL